MQFAARGVEPLIDSEGRNTQFTCDFLGCVVIVD
jgi:hypothetical protein